MSIPIEDLTHTAEVGLISDPHTGDWYVKVLHHTGSSNELGDLNYLRYYHKNPVSVHDLVKRSGLVQKIIPKTRNAWHPGRSCWGIWDWLTPIALGVEICNNGVGEKYTDAQYEAVALNVAFDCAYYHIKDQNVTSHKRVRDLFFLRHPLLAKVLRLERKTDPLGWDWVRMWKRIDQIRAAWPAEFGIPLWYDITGQRVMST